MINKYGEKKIHTKPKGKKNIMDHDNFTSRFTYVINNIIIISDKFDRKIDDDKKNFEQQFKQFLLILDPWLNNAITRLNMYKKKQMQLIDANLISAMDCVDLITEPMFEQNNEKKLWAFFMDLCGWKHDNYGLKAVERVKVFRHEYINVCEKIKNGQNFNMKRLDMAAESLGRWVDNYAP